MSLAEPSLLLATLLSVGWLFASLRARKGRGLRASLEAALDVLSWGGVALVVFFVLFGVDYYRPPLGSRLGWSDLDAPGLRDAARAAVELTNREYEAAFGSNDLGTPAPLPQRLDEGLERGYERLAAQLALGDAFRSRRGRAKPILVSPLLSELRLSGFYFPWTGEANFNDRVPACERAHTIGHEKAHQRGIAREDEANFIGALACLFSEEPSIRYGGAFFAENDLLRELYRRRDPEIRALLASRSAGVVRDTEAERSFWSRYEGLPSVVSEAVNNTYLKSQGVREGTRSYEESPRLLALFFERFCPGGRCGVWPGALKPTGD